MRYLISPSHGKITLRSVGNMSKKVLGTLQTTKMNYLLTNSRNNPASMAKFINTIKIK